MALIDQKVLPKDNVQLFAASKDLDMCTVQGIKDSFQAAAKMTGSCSFISLATGLRLAMSGDLHQLILITHAALF